MSTGVGVEGAQLICSEGLVRVCIGQAINL